MSDTLRPLTRIRDKQKVGAACKLIDYFVKAHLWNFFILTFFIFTFFILTLRNSSLILIKSSLKLLVK